MKSSLSSLFSTLRYCVALSWRSSKWYTLVRLLGKIITPAGGILSAFLLKRILDLLSGVTHGAADPTAELLLLIGGTVALSLLTAAVRKLVEYSEGMHNDILDRYITMDMMEKALSADLELFDNPKYYDKLTSVQRDSYAITYILWNALDCLSSLITFIGSFAVLCGTNVLYGLLMVLAAFPSAIARQRYTKALYQLGLDQVNGERQKNYLYYVASDKIYAQDVRLFGLGDQLRDRYHHLWRDIFTHKKKMVKSRTWLTGTLEFLPELVIGVITLDISFKVLCGGATIGDYSLYTGLLSQLWSAIMLLTNSVMQIYDNKLKIDNVKSFDQVPHRISSRAGGRELRQVGEIAFEHVGFSYPGTERRALEDVSFCIRPGEKVALVGVNGAGKTTLIKLLLRFYDVGSGCIRINGVDIRTYDVDSLRSCFGCYFQNTPNYGFTLRENVALGEARQDEGRILEALGESDAEGVLRQAPQGLDTYLTRMFDENGMELSGGQNQKIALARTFYRDRSGVILDEPSSSLDPEAEHRVFEAMERHCRGKTTLFTSHRLSNLSMADRIVVIENGRIVEQGSRDELLSNPRRFAELYQYQAEKFAVK